jgi:ribonuclease HI
MDFSWNLGVASNNAVKAYAIYQGLLLMQEEQISQISIVGDSKNTIRYLVTGSVPRFSFSRGMIFNHPNFPVPKSRNRLTY